MVVGVMSRWWGGRPLLTWWLWDEEGSHVTVCDMCDFWINVPTLFEFTVCLPQSETDFDLQLANQKTTLMRVTM